MPEGHSLRRLAIAFEESFVGERCQVSSPQGRFAAGAALLDGKKMFAAQSLGKHLFLGFEAPQPLWMHIHLGLYGAWRFGGELPPIAAQEQAIGAPRRLDPDEAIKVDDQSQRQWPPQIIGQVRARLLTERCVADLTGPNTCRVITEDEKLAVESRLGPDPLRHQDGSKERFVDSVKTSKRTVGDLVLDQSIVAGVGNIYRAEALFRQGISPFRMGENVSRARLEALWQDFSYLLAEGVADGFISTVDPVDKPDPASPQVDPESQRWYVYHRAKLPCLRCGNPVRAKDVRGRRLYWCSKCQR